MPPGDEGGNHSSIHLRNEMQTEIIKYFAFAHLPVHLQLVSKPLGELAEQFDQALVDGPEKSAGMRKLLEAKDCFVRAALDAPKPLANSVLQPHQQRVVDEQAELEARLSKLVAFTRTPFCESLDPAERNRLDQQAACMAMYSDILTDRIAAFAPAAAA